MIHIKRLNEMNYREAVSQALNSCDTLRLGMASHTFSCAFGDGEWEELPETHRRIYGQLKPNVVGDTSIEIQWDINISDGTIAGWDSGEVEIYFKVIDMCVYTLMRGNTPVLTVKGEYVPEFLQLEDTNTYGDYISIFIDANGHIRNWNGNQKRQIISFFRKYGSRALTENRYDDRYYYFDTETLAKEVYVTEHFDDEFKEQFADKTNKQLYDAVMSLYDFVAGDTKPNLNDRDDILIWLYEYAYEAIGEQ